MKRDKNMEKRPRNLGLSSPCFFGGKTGTAGKKGRNTASFVLRINNTIMAATAALRARVFILRRFKHVFVVDTHKRTYF